MLTAIEKERIKERMADTDTHRTIIASITQGYHVLQVLNINKDFLKFHPNKKDRIIGLTNGSIMGKFLKEGKIFWVEKENYGAIEVIKFHGNLELKKKLEKQYICGGIGDNYPIMCIENTEENLKEVYGAGLVTYEFLDKQEPVVKYWKENEEKVL